MTSQLTEEIRQKQLFFDQFCTAWSNEYRQRGGTIYCGSGCSGCCSLVVNCTYSEAALVAASLTKDLITGLYNRIQLIQTTATSADSLKEWLSSYRDLSGPCPFLSESGTCTIYQNRPLSCRSLLSTKEPQWCSTDFSTVSRQEKQVFMESLDRSAVAFPTHYAATPQEIGRELEEASLRQMETVYGFSIVGSFLWLVWLELEHSLSARLSDGSEAVQDYLSSRDLYNRFLVVIT